MPSSPHLVYDQFVQADGALDSSNWGPIHTDVLDGQPNAVTGGILVNSNGFGAINAGGGDASSVWNNANFANDQTAIAIVKAVAPYVATLSITAASQSGGNTTYTYTVSAGSVTTVISGGALYVIITGMADAGNNGFFTATTFGAGTFTVANASGVTRAGQTGTGVCPSDSGAGIMVRASADGTTFFGLQVGTNSFSGDGRVAFYEVWKYIAGVSIFLGGNGALITSLPVVGDVYGMSIVGNVLTAFKIHASTRTNIYAASPSGIASGNPGIHSWSMAGASNYVWANWPTIVNPPGNNGTTFKNFVAWDASLTTSPAASDAFVYANGDLHTRNVLWVYALGTFGITTNRAFSNVAGISLAYRSDVAASADQWSKSTAVVTGTSINQNCGPAVRISAANGGSAYCVQYASDLLTIAKMVNGVFTGNIVQTTGCITGDVLTLIAAGQTLIVLKNDVVALVTTDTSLTSGRTGIFSAGNATQNGVSAWSGGLTSPGLGTGGSGGLLLRGVG